MKETFSILVILCLTLFACEQKGENSKKWVNDYEKILTENQIQVLDSIICNFEKRTTNEIVIVTVNDIGDSSKMVDFAIDFSEKWGVGKKDKNNGLVILFSRNMKEIFLATGYGTEEILKDEICKLIVDSTMIPYFEKENFYGGLQAGLLECINRWEK